MWHPSKESSNTSQVIKTQINNKSETQVKVQVIHKKWLKYNHAFQVNTKKSQCRIRLSHKPYNRNPRSDHHICMDGRQLQYLKAQPLLQDLKAQPQPQYLKAQPLLQDLKAQPQPEEHLQVQVQPLLQYLEAQPLPKEHLQVQLPVQHLKAQPLPMIALQQHPLVLPHDLLVRQHVLPVLHYGRSAAAVQSGRIQKYERKVHYTFLK
jgi:hypothetical protein